MAGRTGSSKNLSNNQEIICADLLVVKGKPKVKLPSSGVLLKLSDDKGLVKAGQTLANISAQEIEMFHHDKIRTERRTFSDKESEDTYLSLCAHGCSTSSATNTSSTRSSDGVSKKIQYMSIVKHTWFSERCFEMQSDTPIELSHAAIESLQVISNKLGSSNEDVALEDVQKKISTFLKQFGSHVSLGPFAVGGRLVEKVSSSECKDLNKIELLGHLEDEFKAMDPLKMDLGSSGGEGLFRWTKKEGKDNEILMISREMHIFGGNETLTDFKQWRQSLLTSCLVISDGASFKNMKPVWDIVRENKHIFGEVCDKLSCLLEQAWCKENENVYPIDLGTFGDNLFSEETTETVLHEKNEKCVMANNNFTSNGYSKTEAMGTTEIFEKLHMDKTICSLASVAVLKKGDKDDTELSKDVMWRFIRSIFSLDYRGRKCYKPEPQIFIKDSGLPENTVTDIFTKIKEKKKVTDSQNLSINPMDVTFAILHCCDAFLRQELLWKMVECRLAVPILLPDLANSRCIELQLWGLRKVYKTWKSRLTNDIPLERSVVSHPLPIVSFLRFGKITISKSKLLNKIIGKLQGNSDHSFFVDVEEESSCATFSKGTVEVAWFLPEGMCDDKDPNAFHDAVTFFNLRGDVLDFPLQKQFLCRASDIVVALVEEDQYPKYLDEIRNISENTAKHLICIICSSDSHSQDNIERQNNVTMIQSKRFLSDIGSDVCQELNQVLWCTHTADGRESRFKSIESLTKLCSALNIRIDEDDKDNIKGKLSAKKIKTQILQVSDKYKELHLPLQHKLWKEWAALDKKWNKGCGHEGFASIEDYNDHIKQEMFQIREKQHTTPPKDDILDIVKALQRPIKERQYFVAWLNLYLNDLSQGKLGPLRRELRDIQDKARVINAQKSKLKDNAEMSDDEKALFQKLKDEDETLVRRTRDITNKLDSESLGLEHYMRELGQRFEAHEELKGTVATDVDSPLNVGKLPDIAAELLIGGHPLEILDGDVGRVPLKWFQAVFNSVTAKLGHNKMVFAVSVLGVQSSGKSTLLNSMFGVRFAVSAGRCTRGVFIQLLKVEKDLVKETGCDYVIVIDTEGLKAPERSFRNRNDFRHDNELATFALCLADLTIINIAGQTVGKDMTDVLQIAAHAFIRMKEVRIKSSCRIIQQFVADLAAVDKNEASTQAILTNLDEAISVAAKEEGFDTLYTRFSDVFNLKRDEDIQYIPSLWQGSMAPPNHRYSERIIQLKKVILRELGQSRKSLEQFAERTTSVWNAVKEENFIFNFQSCVSALRYKTFQHAYGKWVGDMRQVVMEWESSAKQRLKNSQKDQLEKTKEKLSNEIGLVISNEADNVKEFIRNYLQENFSDDEDQFHTFEGEFGNDLDFTQKKFNQEVQETLDRTVNSIKQVNQMDVLLPKCKNQLREKARKQAVELRKKYADATTIDTEITKTEIDDHFTRVWDGWIKEICQNYPPVTVTEDDVRMEFNSYLIRQGGRNDISRGLKQKLGISGEETYRNTINYVLENLFGTQKETVSMILDTALATLQMDLDDDRAYDRSLIQKLVDSTIHGLNNKYEHTTLTQEVKINAILQVCSRAIPIILEGRTVYNKKYSLREHLMKEKENLEKDFRALCSSAFQDQRASESLTSLLNEKIVDLIQNYLGPAIYKAVRESCPYFASKFAMFGYVLEDMAEKEEFDSYYRFFFDLNEFLEEWSLSKIAEVCVKKNYSGKSFVEKIVTDKIEDVRVEILHSINSTLSESGSQPVNTDQVRGDDDKLVEWIKQLSQELSKGRYKLSLSDEDTRNLLLFDVKDIKYFGGLVKNYTEQRMMEDILKELCVPRVGCVKEAEKMLQRLPTKPHEEIKKHVSGCTEQCPICHAPCDNMTKQHEKHRAELHYPEGLVGCAQFGSGSLVYTICTSSITTDLEYREGNVTRIYSEFHKDFPNWVIQPIQNDSPLNYWKWVMNRFNGDFAKLYGRREAKLPEGWILISKQQAIEDLREAYVTKQINSP